MLRKPAWLAVSGARQAKPKIGHIGSSLTSVMNCLTASSVAWLVGFAARRMVLCLAVEGRDGGDVGYAE